MVDNKLPPPKKNLGITDTDTKFNNFQSSPINIPPLRDAAAEEETKRNLFKNKISGLIIGVTISFALMGVSFWWGLEIGRKSISENTNPIPIIRAENKPIKVLPKDPGGLEIPHKDILVLDNSKDSDNQQVVLLPEPEKPIISKNKNNQVQKNILNQNLLNNEKNLTERKNQIIIEKKEVEDIKIQNNMKEEENKKIIVLKKESENKKIEEKKLNNKNKLTDKIQNFKTNSDNKKINNNLKIDKKSLLYKVQLASYRKKESALKGWNELSKKYLSQFKDLSPSIEKVDINNKGIFFRLQTGEFSVKQKAQDLCNQLKTLKLTCIVVKK